MGIVTMLRNNLRPPWFDYARDGEMVIEIITNPSTTTNVATGTHRTYFRALWTGRLALVRSPLSAVYPDKNS